MEPQLKINFLAIIACMVSNAIIGSLWYGPLFGKAWAKEVGVNFDQKPATSVMLKSMGLMVFGSFLTAFVLAHSTEVWRPSVWGAGTDIPNWHYGYLAAFFTFIGFYVPLHFNSVAFENRSWKLFNINAGYSLVSLLAMGQILANWR